MNEIVSAMEKDLRDVDNLAKYLDQLLRAAETEKNVDHFQNALNCVNNSVKINQKVNTYVQAVINFYHQLVSMKSCQRLVNSVPIHSFLTNLLISCRDRPRESSDILSVIGITIDDPRVCPYYSNPQFISQLVYIARLNSKQYKIVKKVCKITQYLDPRLGAEYKDLCTVIVLISRSLNPQDPKQLSFMSAFAQVSNEKVLLEVGNIAIPLFTEICMKQPSNFKICKCLFTIASKCQPDQFDKQIIQLIDYQSKQIRDDPSTLSSAISILSSKVNPHEMPAFVVPISYSALQIFFSDKKVIEDSLTVCFRGLTATNQNNHVSTSIPAIITSIMSQYIHEKGIVRRCAAILHTLSADPENDNALIFSAAAQSLVQAISSNTDDQHTIVLCTSSLNNVILENRTLATQISTPENIQLFQNLAKSYPKNAKIIKHIVMIVQSIILAQYEMIQFIDLPKDTKKRYQIDSKYIIPSLKSDSDDDVFVKASLLVMSPRTQITDTISSLMMKFSSDYDIVIECLSLGIKDIGIINRALITTGEDGFRFVAETLQQTEEAIPMQTISLLLSLDNPDAVSILLHQLECGNDSVIASQFSLQFNSQTVLAKKLLERGLWLPGEDSVNIVLDSLCFARNDANLVVDVLDLCAIIGLTRQMFPILLDLIGRHPSCPDVVETCIKFALRFPVDQETGRVCKDYNSIINVSTALSKMDKNEKISYLLLTFLDIVAPSNDLASQFSEPMVLSAIAKAAQLSDRCAVEASRIFSNLSQSQITVDILSKLGALDIAFKSFGPGSYLLVHNLVSKGCKLNNEQIDLIMNEFDDHASSYMPETAFSLLELMLDLIETEDKLSRLPSKKSLCQVFSTFSTNPNVVEMAARVAFYLKLENDDDEIVFALSNALKANANVFRAVFAIVNVYSTVNRMDVPSLDSPSVVQGLVDVAEIYQGDSAIVVPILTILRGRKEAVKVECQCLNHFKGEEDIAATAQYLLSCGQCDYTKYIQDIINTIASHQNSFDIVTCLAPVIYFAAENEKIHKHIIAALPVLLDATSRFVSSNRLSRAIPAIVYKLSENLDMIPKLEDAPPKIATILKAWPNDPQINQATSGIIVNFASAGCAELFRCCLPMILQRLDKYELIETTCESVQAMASVCGAYAPVITDKLFNILVTALSENHDKDEEEDEENAKLQNTVSETLQHLAKNDNVEGCVYAKLKDVFEILKTDAADDLKINMINFCMNLHSVRRIDDFKPFMEDLMKILEGPKLKVATAAGQLMLQIARLKPDLVDPFLNRVMAVGKVSSGDQLRVCIAIKDQIFGIKKA